MAWTTHDKHRNNVWAIRVDDKGLFDQDAVQRCILLDIREELRQLNRVFTCPRFLAIPSYLQAIDKQTRKPKKKRKAKPKA